MDMNTVLAVLGVIVAAVIVIALSIWLGKSRKRDLDRAMGKVAPDNKKTRDAKAAADYITDDVDHDGVRNALLHFRVLRD